jgi:transcriptional regulator with XRE-family HTH domain
MTAESREASPIDIAVGARIRQVREMRGLSAQQLADHFGLSQQQFQKYEAGKNRVSAGRLWEIAKILRTSILYFYEGIDPIPARVRRGRSEDAAEFSGPLSEASGELVSAFERIEDEDVRTALIAEAKKQAWAAARHGGKAKS